MDPLVYQLTGKCNLIENIANHMHECFNSSAESDPSRMSRTTLGAAFKELHSESINAAVQKAGLGKKLSIALTNGDIPGFALDGDTVVRLKQATTTTTATADSIFPGGLRPAVTPASNQAAVRPTTSQAAPQATLTLADVADARGAESDGADGGAEETKGGDATEAAGSGGHRLTRIPATDYALIAALRPRTLISEDAHKATACIGVRENMVYLGELTSIAPTETEDLLGITSDICDTANTWRSDDERESHSDTQPGLEHAVFFNVVDPFTCTIVGLPGYGKSHTAATLLESCVVSSPNDKVCVSQPMAAMVLHFDSANSHPCELSYVHRLRQGLPATAGCQVPRVVVFCSPDNLQKRKEFYGEGFEVYPLLFRWADLRAEHIRALMRIEPSAQQLYISVALRWLRQYQRTGVLPDYQTFKSGILDDGDLTEGQAAPLRQRLELLDSVILESAVNQDAFRASDASVHYFTQFMVPGTVLIADLTDPQLSAHDASAIFQVLLELFRTAEGPGSQRSKMGKIVVLDEAHKYLERDGGGLIATLLETTRQRRHYNMRSVVVSQSPATLPDELFELSSATILHRFHVRDWFSYLQKKIPLNEQHWDAVLGLPRGNALAFFESMRMRDGSVRAHAASLAVRERLTRDLGATLSHCDGTQVEPAADTTSQPAQPEEHLDVVKSIRL